MLVRGILAAALGAVLHRSNSVSDKKGKGTASTRRSSTSTRTPIMSPTTTTAAAVAAAATMTGKMRRNYGSVGSGRFERLSRSGDRLDSVPEREQVDGYGREGGTEGEGEEAGEREPFVWNGLEEAGSESSNGDEEFDEWDASRYDYRHALRWYSIVPLGSILLFVLIALLPKLIAPKPRPSSPPLLRLLFSTILSAALWCLAHSSRVPLHSILDWIIHWTVSGLIAALSFLLLPQCSRRTRQTATAAYVASITSIIHALFLAFLQESLRVAAFAILDLRWYQLDGRPSSTRHPRAHDAAFREVWALAMGWALAEICAGVLQGYEQLALYADFGSSPNQRASEGSSKSGDEVVAGNGANNGAFEEEGADFVRWSMPCVGSGDDDDMEGVKALTQVEIDEALIRLANVRAREELEDLYGQPFIEIPVFVALLQRLNSILLSLGNTLFLAAAYLPIPPHSSSLFITSQSSSATRESPSHTHMIPLLPAFFIVALVHAALGILHAPPVLARIGIPAAAYASCIVGLALTFAGAGVWIGLW